MASTMALAALLTISLSVGSCSASPAALRWVRRDHLLQNHHNTDTLPQSNPNSEVGLLHLVSSSASTSASASVVLPETSTVASEAKLDPKQFASRKFGAFFMSTEQHASRKSTSLSLTALWNCCRAHLQKLHEKMQKLQPLLKGGVFNLRDLAATQNEYARPGHQLQSGHIDSSIRPLEELDWQMYSDTLDEDSFEPGEASLYLPREQPAAFPEASRAALSETRRWVAKAQQAVRHFLGASKGDKSTSSMAESAQGEWGEELRIPRERSLLQTYSDDVKDLWRLYADETGF